MLRVLMSSVGSSGDIHPFIAVGQALVHRGHEVTLLANPFFERAIRDAGIGFRPLGEAEEVRRLLTSPKFLHPVRGQMMVWKYFIDLARTTVPAMRSAIEAIGPDVVVRHPMSNGVRCVCLERQLPCVVLALQPGPWMSVEDRVTSTVSATAVLQRLAWTVGFKLARPVHALVMGGRYDRLNRELGFPPERDPMRREFVDGRLLLGLWSPIFRAPMPDDPPRSTVCGFPWFDAPSDASGSIDWAEVDAFLEHGDGRDPPVVFALGTTAVHQPGAYFEIAVEACRRIGRRALLLTGASDVPRSARDAGASVRAYPYLPFSRVLPRGACTVHHGGIGSTAQALRAGRPMIVVPFSFDQPDNAARARRLGVAAVLPRARFSADRLAATLTEVLGDDAMHARARSMASRMGAEDGAAMAAEQIACAARGECAPASTRSAG